MGSKILCLQYYQTMSNITILALQSAEVGSILLYIEQIFKPVSGGSQSYPLATQSSLHGQEPVRK